MLKPYPIQETIRLRCISKNKTYTMKEIERFERLKEMGFTYNPETGDITSHRGKIIKGKDSSGYIGITLYISRKIYCRVIGHRFCYWFYYGIVPDVIDHINRVRDDNRICNLRNGTQQKNMFNMDCKGYTYDKRLKKYRAHIVLNNKTKYLGYYQTEAEARQSYLDGKKIYHII
jgi:hypothetical protein